MEIESWAGICDILKARRAGRKPEVIPDEIVPALDVHVFFSLPMSMFIKFWLPRLERCADGDAIMQILVKEGYKYFAECFNDGMRPAQEDYIKNRAGSICMIVNGLLYTMQVNTMVLVREVIMDLFTLAPRARKTKAFRNTEYFLHGNPSGFWNVAYRRTSSLQDACDHVPDTNNPFADMAYKSPRLLNALITGVYCFERECVASFEMSYKMTLLRITRSISAYSHDISDNIRIANQAPDASSVAGTDVLVDELAIIMDMQRNLIEQGPRKPTWWFTTQ